MSPNNFALLLMSIVLGGFLALAAVSYGREYVGNLRQPLQTVPVQITGRRVYEDQGSGWSAAALYYVTFSEESGQTHEFSVSEAEYQRLKEGQRGFLRSQGTLYRGFHG